MWVGGGNSFLKCEYDSECGVCFWPVMLILSLFLLCTRGCCHLSCASSIHPHGSQASVLKCRSDHITVPASDLFLSLCLGLMQISLPSSPAFAPQPCRLYKSQLALSHCGCVTLGQLLCPACSFEHWGWWENLVIPHTSYEDSVSYPCIVLRIGPGTGQSSVISMMTASLHTRTHTRAQAPLSMLPVS
jgi:hypothetical protein